MNPRFRLQCIHGQFIDIFCGRCGDIRVVSQDQIDNAFGINRLKTLRGIGQPTQELCGDSVRDRAGPAPAEAGLQEVKRDIDYPSAPYDIALALNLLTKGRPDMPPSEHLVGRLQYFAKIGLVQRDESGDCATYIPVAAALEQYFSSLKKVPFPINIWVTPR